MRIKIRRVCSNRGLRANREQRAESRSEGKTSYRGYLVSQQRAERAGLEGFEGLVGLGVEQATVDILFLSREQRGKD
jgi:hypothetical protein